ncbi:MAG: hypothetical protein QOK87_03920 [Nitrososphaeraceae archaeon]|nr:hypothetical protein [Nitrososphaeraceae archaeon]MDW0139414.1 hypothetical protein [Nitrososphaeraceae archaeon]MDW0151250.1 hypothetical protein [Nitrososphaeraceae archaeon]
MLGELIGETKGKISNRNVVSVEGPTIETTVASSGTLKGVQVNEILTYVASPSSKGILHGIGRGVINTQDGEIATFTGEGIGRFDASGLLTWRGAIFFHTSSEGKLEFLNNKVGVFEAQVDSQGNFTDKTWEWE